jgi:hypothetical protein
MNRSLECVDGATRYRWAGHLHGGVVYYEGYRVGDFMVRHGHPNELFQQQSGGPMVQTTWVVEHFPTGGCLLATDESAAWFLADEMAVMFDGIADLIGLARAFGPHSDWIDEVQDGLREKWRPWCARQRREDAAARAVLGLDGDAPRGSS